MTPAGGRLSCHHCRVTWRSVLATLTLAGVLAGFLSTVASAQERAALPNTTTTQKTLEDMATCLRSRDRLLLVLLVDESGSLRTTDPTNERVTAARLALRSFASLASTSVAGRKPRIDVLVAGFSSDFATVTPWSTLDESHIASVEQSVEGFATRNSGLDTDFPNAFLGARRELAARSATLSERGSGEPCKAILLFTDGRYDVAVGDTPARRAAGTEKSYAPGVSLLDPANGPIVEAAGRDLMCRADGTGLADRLRSDGAVIITVALAAQIDAADQSFLRALSTGRSGDLTCGSGRVGEGGAYLAAGELSELAPAFTRIGASIAGATEAPGTAVVAACARSQCERGRRSFELDPILRKLTVLADISTAAVVVQLHDPRSTEPVVLTSGADGEKVLAAAHVKWSWLTKTTVEIDAELPQGRDEWVGRWSVTFVDPTGSAPNARPRADVFLYGGWSPSIPGSAHLLRGEKGTVTIVVVDAGGAPVEAGTLVDAGARIEATFTDPTTHERRSVGARGPDPQGRFRADFSVGADTRASALDLDLRLATHTRAGIELAPNIARYQIDVAVPDLYPHIKTSQLRLTSVRGTEAARGTVEVVGGRDRSGCIWFERPVFTSFPSEALSFSAKLSPEATKASCLEIVAGETRTVTVELRPSAVSEGAVRGTLTVFASASSNDKPLAVAVPFSFDVAPPIDEVRRAGLFVAILLAGVLAPLAALVLVNRRMARYEPPQQVVYTRLPVRVECRVDRVLREFGSGSSPSAIEESASDPAPGLDPATFVPLGSEHRRAREIACDSLRFTTRAPWNPFGTAYGKVECNRPCAVGGPHRTSADPFDRVPLALAGSWVFILGNPGESGRWIEGDLVVFLSAGQVDEHLPSVVASLRERLSIVANDLASTS